MRSGPQRDYHRLRTTASGMAGGKKNLKHLFEPVFQVQRSYLGQFQLQMTVEPGLMTKIGDQIPFNPELNLPFI
jgi:hypothetical protein